MGKDKDPGLIVLLQKRIKKYIRKKKPGRKKETLLFLVFLIGFTAAGRLYPCKVTRVAAFTAPKTGGHDKEAGLSIAMAGSLSLLPPPGKNVFNNHGNLREFFSAADLNILSLDVPLPGAETNTDSSRELLEELAQKNFRLLPAAGNGLYQEGLTGVAATLSNLQKHNFHPLGAGLNLGEAFSPYRMEKGTIKISFLAINASLSPDRKAGKNRLGTAYFDEEILFRLLEELAGDGNQVIVYVSFRKGTGFTPRPEERELARKLIDMGAKYVVGTGTGIVRETEPYRDGVIFYGLGDLTPGGCYSFYKEALLVHFFFYPGGAPEVTAIPLVFKKGEWAVAGRQSCTERLASYKIFRRLNGNRAWNRTEDYFTLKPVETRL